MRHRKQIEAFTRAGIWFYQHVPIPFFRVVPLKIFTFALVLYWRIFGID